MSIWIDFKELRQKLSIEAILKAHHVPLKVKGDRASAFCPLPTHPRREDGKKHTPSFSVHLKKGIWQCFSCHARGNVLDLGVRLLGFDPDDPAQFRKAALKLQEQFGLSSGTKPRSAPKAPAEKPAVTEPDGDKPTEPAPAPTVDLPVVVNAPLDFELKHLDPAHPYLSSRGFTPETIEHFGLGFCGKGMMKDRIAIPLHDPKGHLVGYAGRLVDDSAVNADNPKYRFPGTREKDGKKYEFHKSELLYNFHRIGRLVNDLIVVEGFASVWWLDQNGYNDVVAVMGSSVSPAQRQLILDLLSDEGRLWIMSDEDQAGEAMADDLLHHMASRRWCWWVRYEPGQQPTDLTADELAAMLWEHQ